MTSLFNNIDNDASEKNIPQHRPSIALICKKARWNMRFLKRVNFTKAPKKFGPFLGNPKKFGNVTWPTPTPTHPPTHPTTNTKIKKKLLQFSEFIFRYPNFLVVIWYIFGGKWHFLSCRGLSQNGQNFLRFCVIYTFKKEDIMVHILKI